MDVVVWCGGTGRGMVFPLPLLLKRSATGRSGTAGLFWGLLGWVGLVIRGGMGEGEGRVMGGCGGWVAGWRVCCLVGWGGGD